VHDAPACTWPEAEEVSWGHDREADMSQTHTDQTPGSLTFAAMLMILAGTFHLVQGVVALVNDDFYVTGQEYLFRFDLTTWGWIHLLAGVAVVLVGIGLVQGADWAEIPTVILAGVSVLASFLWMPYYPIWSLTVIAFDVFVIWALVSHGRVLAQV
jgi:hypothetical protein